MATPGAAGASGRGAAAGRPAGEPGRAAWRGGRAPPLVPRPCVGAVGVGWRIGAGRWGAECRRRPRGCPRRRWLRGGRRACRCKARGLLAAAVAVAGRWLAASAVASPDTIAAVAAAVAAVVAVVAVVVVCSRKVVLCFRRLLRVVRSVEEGIDFCFKSNSLEIKKISQNSARKFFKNK